MTTLKNQRAYFMSLDVLGDPAQFTAAIFTGNALQEDSFLGIEPGTTAYGPCEGGGAIAVTGVLTGPTEAAVAAAQATLAALAGLPGRLIVPTGLTMSGWDTWDSCQFQPGDLAWSAIGITTNAYPGYQLGYRLVFRRAGTLILSGFVAVPDPGPFPGAFVPEGLPV